MRTLGWLFLIAAASAVAQIGGSGTKGDGTDPPRGGDQAPWLGRRTGHGVETIARQRQRGCMYRTMPAGGLIRSPFGRGIPIHSPGTWWLMHSHGGDELQLEGGPTTERITYRGAMELARQDARLGQTVRNDMYTGSALSMGNGNHATRRILLPDAGMQEGGTLGFVNGGQIFSKVCISRPGHNEAVRQGECRPPVRPYRWKRWTVTMETAANRWSIRHGSENYTIMSGSNELTVRCSSTSGIRCWTGGFICAKAPAAEPNSSASASAVR